MDRARAQVPGEAAPAVKPEQPVSGTVHGSAYDSQTTASVAWNGSVYLVVWTDTRNAAASDFDIYGARLDSTGDLLDDGGIPITRASRAQHAPAVAWNGSAFQVVWEDDRNSANQNVSGRARSGAGVVLDPNGVQVTFATREQTEVSIASNGTISMVTWRDDRAGGFLSENVYGTRLDSNGALIDITGFAIAVAANGQIEPTIAWNGTTFFVAWADNRASFENLDIYGSRVSAAGVVQDPAGIPISTAALEQYAPAVASNGTDFYVTWHDHRSNASYDLYGTGVSAAGVVAAATGTVISNAAGDQWNPSVTWNGSNYVLAWVDLRGGGTFPEEGDIYSTRVSAGGVVQEAAGTVVSAAAHAQTSPDIASNGTDSFVAWTDYRVVTSDVFGARVTAAAAVQDPSGILVSNGPSRGEAPAIAWNPTAQQFFVVWEDLRGGFASDLYGARLDKNGNILDASGIAISARPGDAEFRPAVTWSGTEYLVVWEDTRNFNAGGGGPLCVQCDDIFGARVSAGGTVLDPDGLLISGADQHQVDPAVAWNGSTYLVVWTDDRAPGNRHDIYGGLVSSAGVVSNNNTVISEFSGGQNSPTVASNGTDFLVAWSSAVLGDIHASRVTGAAAVLDPTGIPVGAADGIQSEPSVAWSGNRYLVAWTDARLVTETNVYGALVDAGGAVTSAATGIPISTATRDQRTPAVTNGSSGWFVAWRDERAGAGLFDVYGSRLNAGGTVQDTAGLVVAVSTDDEEAPAVVQGPGKEYRIAYQRFSSEAPYNGMSRVYSRKMPK